MPTWAYQSADPSTAKRAPGFDSKPVNLIRLAAAQKWLIWCVFARLFAEIWLLVSMQSAVGIVHDALAATYILIYIFSVVMIARLAAAYGMHPIGGAIIAIPLAAPCIGALALPLLNMHVTATLRKGGARVGLMGVSVAEMNKLLEGACSSCGYDIRGLDSPVCPECGRKHMLASLARPASEELSQPPAK
jgi:hypothetical protein